MNTKDKEVLLKILKHTENIENFCKDCFSEKDFIDSEKTLSATSFELLQIGELAKMKLSDEAKDVIGNVPWDSIYGLRNRIVHGYNEINYNILWTTISDDIPVLKEEILNAFKKENKQSKCR